MFDGKEVAAEVVKTVRDYVTRSTDPIKQSLAELDQRVKSIPIPKDGKDASPEQIREAVSIEVADAMSGLTDAIIEKFSAT